MQRERARRITAGLAITPTAAGRKPILQSDVRALLAQTAMTTCLTLALLLTGCVHLPVKPTQDPPCVLPQESPHVRAAARSAEEVARGSLRIDVDGDGSEDLLLMRNAAGDIVREELHARGGPSEGAAASVRETGEGASHFLRESRAGRRSLDVIRRQRVEGADEFLIATTDAPRSTDAPVVRRELLLQSSTGAAVLNEGFDRDRDGFYGHSTQRVVSRIQPWDGSGSLRLPRTTERCDAPALESLHTALDLAVMHGARCVHELVEDAGNGAAKSRLRLLEWLVARTRYEIEFVCLPVPLCGAVDLLHVAQAWLGEGPAVMTVGSHAFDEKRCGPLAATVGRLLRYYDPASFALRDPAADAFVACLAEASLTEPACEKREEEAGSDENHRETDGPEPSTSGED